MRSAPLWLIFLRAEVDEVHYRGFAAAGLRRGGAGIVVGVARGLRRGHSVGSHSRRGRVLGCDFFTAAQTHVDLRLRSRADTRGLDLAVRRVG